MNIVECSLLEVIIIVLFVLVEVLNCLNKYNEVEVIILFRWIVKDCWGFLIIFEIKNYNKYYDCRKNVW